MTSIGIRLPRDALRRYLVTSLPHPARHAKPLHYPSALDTIINHDSFRLSSTLHSATRPGSTASQGVGAAVGTFAPAVAGSALPTMGSPSKADKFPQVIPEVSPHGGRNLVLCFDGTGDQYDNDNSNIVRFFQLLKKDDTEKQMVYYQAGIGTGVGSNTTRFYDKLTRVVDQAFAHQLGKHVRGGYEFLMQNYKEGDRISLFGFSRGAYTARALAGMLQKVGLLPAYNCEQVRFAYRMFKRDDEEGWKMSNGFKRAFCTDVKIDFLGVFDTVNSVGWIPQQLPFTKSNYFVRIFRHAVALDERRGKFKANMWGRATEPEEKLSEDGRKREYHPSRPRGEGLGSLAGMRRFISRFVVTSDEGIKGCVHRNGHDYVTAEERSHQTDAKEVWFAGGHRDVGGGSVLNDTPNCLARIPLRWMIRECFANETGILFQSAELDTIGLNPSTLQPAVNVPSDTSKPADIPEHPQVSNATLTNTDNTVAMKTPLSAPDTPVSSEQVELTCPEDAKDALCPIDDQLRIAPWWWILEFLPMSERHQRHDGSWRTQWRFNLGRPRTIHGQKRFDTYVHRSVRFRMQNSNYEPRAALLKEPRPPVWVD